MARPKTKTARFLVSVTEEQEHALGILMATDMATNVSDYIGRMIAELTRRRANDK